MNAYDRVTEALQRSGCKQKGHDWTCPHHKGGAERDPSLSVNVGEKGVVMICQAGCDNEDVLHSVGLKLSDLFDEPLEPKRKEIRATYDYVNEAGELLYQVVRYEPKEFRQRTPKDGGGWNWKLNGAKKVPYRLPELLDALNRGIPVHIVEGEKDADAIVRAGGVATCNSGGAGKWPKEFAKLFKNATITIVQDKDESGKKHAREVAESFIGTEDNVVYLVEPKVGKDAFDHLAAGFELDEFLPAFDDRDVGEPEQNSDGDLPEPEVRINPFRERALGIDDIDKLPPPRYIVNDLLVADSLACIWGLPGSTKSFIALAWSLAMAHGTGYWLGKEVQAGPVLYVAGEGASGIGKRKRAWRKQNPTHTAGDLTWLTDPVNLLDTRIMDDFLEFVDELQPMLVVLDTLALSMPGADENAPAPMSQAVESMHAIRRLTRACVLSVHHSPRDGSNPRGHSSLDGALQTSIKVTKTDGVINLSVEKQKDGEPIEMGLVIVKEPISDSAMIELRGDRVNTDESLFSEAVIVKTMRSNAGPDGLSNAELLELSGLAKATFFRARKTMIEKGRLVQLKSRRWVLNDNAD